MRPSEKIRKKMREWEGCSLQAYLCPAGVWTVCYGHTGPDVTQDTVITRQEADALFDMDLDRFARLVEAEVSTMPLTQGEFDALVSFAYNVGMANFRASTLLKEVRANPFSEKVHHEFMRWTKARVNGRIQELPGLVKRRRAELQHYLGGDFME